MFCVVGGFGCVTVVKKLGLKNLIWLECDREYKKVIEVGKSYKRIQTFSFKAFFVHFNGKRYIFGYHQREAVVAAVNLI